MCLPKTKANTTQTDIWRLDQHKAIASAHIIVSGSDLTSFAAQARTIRECLHAYGIHSVTLQPELLLLPPPPPLPPSVCPSASDSVSSAGAAMGRDGGGKGEGEGGVLPVHQSSAAPLPCQMVCGRGMCDHLMCCSGLGRV